MNDTKRINKLEIFLLKYNTGTGVAIMPLNNGTLFSIDDIGDEDGSDFSDELCCGGNLREAIDNLKISIKEKWG